MGVQWNADKHAVQWYIIRTWYYSKSIYFWYNYISYRKGLFLYLCWYLTKLDILIICINVNWNLELWKLRLMPPTETCKLISCAQFNSLSYYFNGYILSTYNIIINLYYMNYSSKSPKVNKVVGYSKSAWWMNKLSRLVFIDDVVSESWGVWLKLCGFLE